MFTCGLVRVCYSGVCVQKAETVEPSEADIAASAKAKAKLLAPDSLLTGSNFMNVSECLLLRWLSYHHNVVAGNSGDTPRRVVDFDRDLHDGVVLARVVLSHCPHLGDDGRELANLKWRPANEEDYIYNTQVCCCGCQRAPMLGCLRTGYGRA